jgi:hypothetical protein
MKQLLLSCAVALSATLGLTAQGFSEEAKHRVVLHFFLGIEGDQSKPMRDVIVFLPPTDHIADESLIKWLKTNASPSNAQTREFSIVDGQLVPSTSIAFVGDVLRASRDERFPLKVSPFENPAYCGLSPDFKLLRTERGPIGVEIQGPSDSKRGRVLVSDHTVNRVSDRYGMIEFESLPAMENLTFSISAVPANAKQRFQYTLPTIKRNHSRGRFTLDTRIQNQEHVIYAEPIEK